MKSIRRGVSIIQTSIIEFYNFFIGEFYQKMCIRFAKYYKILLATARKSMKSIRRGVSIIQTSMMELFVKMEIRIQLFFFVTFHESRI